jgi:hypothetical protein
MDKPGYSCLSKDLQRAMIEDTPEHDAKNFLDLSNEPRSDITKDAIEHWQKVAAATDLIRHRAIEVRNLCLSTNKLGLTQAATPASIQQIEASDRLYTSMGR